MMTSNLEGLLSTSSRDTIWRPGYCEKCKIWLESIEWLCPMKRLHVANMRGHPHECISSVHPAVSNSLRPRGLQHTRLPCPSPTPGACSNSCLLWVSDAIQPSHPSLSPSPAFNLSQHQGLFQWVSSSHQVANVLKLQLQPQSFQWIFRIYFL